MPQQGPGTKLVLKGLRRAVPHIAEQRDREEREEREEREDKHASRNGNVEHGQEPAINPEDAGDTERQSTLQSHHQSKTHSRSGSIREGRSGHVSSIQDSRTSQSGSIREGDSHHSGSIRQGHSLSLMSRRPSVYSNADSTGRRSRHSTEATVGHEGDRRES